MNNIIDILKKSTNTSSKTSEKILFNFIQNKNNLTSMIDVCNWIEKNISICDICFFYKINNICNYCNNKKRTNKQICVVSNLVDAQKILDIEYKGKIHVLNGEINISRNILPENLTIDSLFKRLENNPEIILALNYTREGDVTANYLEKILKNKKCKITRFIKGFPSGNVLNYVDIETLNSAFKNRR